MAIMKKHRQQVRGSIVFLPIEEIQPNPAQPRKHFHRDGLEELAASINEHGVLQPLTVRMRNGTYELIAGERRLRASKMAGLQDVPCILLNVNTEESSLIALVENLQRKDLDVIEEAEGIAQLIRMFGMSQEDAAKRLGKSQSSIANKLRLLRLPSDVLQKMREEQLSERHGRALLRLRTAEAQRAALDYIIDQNLNVAATESFVEYLMHAPVTETPIHASQTPASEPPFIHSSQSPVTAENTPVPPSIYTPSETPAYTPTTEDTFLVDAAKERSGKMLFVLKDVKIFLNSLARGLAVMKQGGIDVAVDQRETKTDLVLTINIPKTNHSSDSE